MFYIYFRNCWDLEYFIFILSPFEYCTTVTSDSKSTKLLVIIVLCAHASGGKDSDGHDIYNTYILYSVNGITNPCTSQVRWSCCVDVIDVLTLALLHEGGVCYVVVLDVLTLVLLQEGGVCCVDVLDVLTLVLLQEGVVCKVDVLDVLTLVLLHEGFV